MRVREKSSAEALQLRNSILDGTLVQSEKYIPVTLSSLPTVLSKAQIMAVESAKFVSLKHYIYTNQWLGYDHISNYADSIGILSAQHDPYLSYVAKNLLSLLYIGFNGPSYTYHPMTSARLHELTGISRDSIKIELVGLIARGYVWGMFDKPAISDGNGYFYRISKIPNMLRIPMKDEYERFRKTLKRGPIQFHNHTQAPSFVIEGEEF
jgi:hypothetical protein